MIKYTHTHNNGRDYLSMELICVSKIWQIDLYGQVLAC